MNIRLLQYFPQYFRDRKLHFSLYFIAALLVAGSAHAELGSKPTSEYIIREMYVAYYGRPADSGGLTFWTRFLDENRDFNNLMAEFGSSDEYTYHYGSLNNGELIDALYQQMFNRLPDPEGREFYISRLESGEVSLGLIAKQIADGATGDDDLALRNKVRVSVPWTEYDFGSTYYAAVDITEIKAVIALVSSEPESLARGMISVSQLLRLHSFSSECPDCIWTDSSQSLEITLSGTWEQHRIANIQVEDIPPLALEYLQSIELTTDNSADYCVYDSPNRQLIIRDVSGGLRSFPEIKDYDCETGRDGVMDWEINLLLYLLPEYEGEGSWSDLVITPPIVTLFSVEDKFGQASDSFVVGDEVHITYRIKNTSTEALDYASTQRGHQLTIIGHRTASGNVWNKGYSWLTTADIRFSVLEAGEELVFDTVWTGVDNDGNPVDPGRYEIRPHTSIWFHNFYRSEVLSPASVFITLQ